MYNIPNHTTELLVCSCLERNKLTSCRTYLILLHENSNLNERAFRLDDLDHNHHRYANHGGEGESPAQTNGPVWILIDFVVRQRLVFDQRENETSLKKNQKHKLIHQLINLIPSSFN